MTRFKKEVGNNTYSPNDDSYLLVKAVEKELDTLDESDKILDMGTGSGIIAFHAAKKGNPVTAVDINPNAIETAKKNIGHKKNIKIIESNLYSELNQDKYSLITFNPPYLPVENELPEKDKWIENSWSGGKTGRETINKFIENSHNYLESNGKILLLISTTTEPKKVIKKARKHGYKVKKTLSKKIFFEELIVLKLKPKP